MLYQVLRPLLFRIDPETVHELAVQLLTIVEALPDLGCAPPSHPLLEQRLWGLEFRNPLGLAAGFDKNARLPHVWQRFGFGFAELGTVTARPQPGNPRPRLFRLRDEEALINRLGFNNDGAAAVAARLRARLATRPVAIPIGINIGKSAAAALVEAPEDYRQSYQLLAGLADYVTINVSSPNTVGLRDLQASRSLAAIVDALRTAAPPAERTDSGRRGGHPPLLVKVAPDLDDGQLRDVVDLALQRGIDGLIATNTTVRRDMLPPASEAAAQPGGLSGRPLAARSTEVVRTLRTMTAGRIPIIGVGGIFDADDAFAKICAGADLLQIYTGFVYGGPAVPRRIVAGLQRRLAAGGFATLADAVGSAGG